jgi:phosphatidylglycerol:prolipoprotein diacylglycerol transferase
MHPEIFGHSSYFTSWAVAAVLGVVLGTHHLGREGVAPGRALLVLLGLAVLMVAGAKAQALLETWLFGRSAIAVAAMPARGTPAQGFHMPGGMLLIALGLPVLCAALGLPARRVGDAALPAVGAAIAMTRVGCFLNGCCFGTVTSLPWALGFPAGSPAYAWHMHAGWIGGPIRHSLPVHPLQLYYLAHGVMLWGLGRRWWRQRRFDGMGWLYTTTLYFAGTFALDLLRQERIHANLVLTAGATVALVAVTAATRRRVVALSSSCS